VAVRRGTVRNGVVDGGHGGGVVEHRVVEGQGSGGGVVKALVEARRGLCWSQRSARRGSTGVVWDQGSAGLCWDAPAPSREPASSGWGSGGAARRGSSMGVRWGVVGFEPRAGRSMRSLPISEGCSSTSTCGVPSRGLRRRGVDRARIRIKAVGVNRRGGICDDGSRSPKGLTRQGLWSLLDTYRIPRGRMGRWSRRRFNPSSARPSLARCPWRQPELARAALAADQDVLVAVSDGMSAHDREDPGFVPNVSISYGHLTDVWITRGEEPGDPAREKDLYLSRSDATNECIYPRRCVVRPRRVVSAYALNIDHWGGEWRCKGQM